jgi:hypothetical protein
MAILRIVGSVALATAILFGCLTASMASTQKRIALVIGNAAYREAPPLANTRNDATDLSVVLSRLGFQVLEGINLDKREMERLIRRFDQEMVGADIALFFYSGHGLQVSGQNYLVPIDARLAAEGDLDFESVPLRLVLSRMEREAKTSLVLLDACRDNPLSRNLARSMGTRSTNLGQGLAEVRTGVGTLISFSTQPGNVALDGVGERNSPYTTALLREIEEPGRDLITTLAAVRGRVVQATDGRQVPWEHTSLFGPVVLKTSSDPAAPAAPPSSVAPSPVANVQPAATARHHPAPTTGAGACAAQGEVNFCVSSVLPTSGVNTGHYGPSSLFDKSKSTAWVEGNSGDGRGEWIVLSWPRERRLAGLRIINGYAKSTRLFDSNGRVTRARLSFSDGRTLDVSLRDTADEQRVAIEPSISTYWVRIELLEVMRGSRYADTAITEVAPEFE